MGLVNVGRASTVLLAVFSLLALSGPTVSATAEAASGPVIFEDDFEDQNPSCWSERPNGGGWNLAGCGGWISIGQGSHVALAVGETSHSGTKAMRITFTRDENFGGADVRIDRAKHVFTRRYDYYAPNFDFAFGMKIHRLRSFNGIKNDFDIVSHARAFGTPFAENLSGTNDMSAIDIAANGGPVDWGSASGGFSFQRNRWYCVETEVELNDPGQNNGAVRIWIDGDLRVKRTGINIRGNLSSSINQVLFGGWYSNGAAGKNPEPDPAGPSIRYIDDVVISTERIGCLPDVADRIPPRQPTGLRVNVQ